MKFNREKFLELTNHSNSYHEWSEKILSALEKCGCKHPLYDYEKHDFSFYIKAEHSQAKLIRIYAYDNGTIQFLGTHKRMNYQDLELAYEGIAAFVFEMQKLGVIC